VIKILRRQQKEFLNLTEELIVVRYGNIGCGVSIPKSKLVGLLPRINVLWGIVSIFHIKWNNALKNGKISIVTI
jgi:hypothetical protein